MANRQQEQAQKMVFSWEWRQWLLGFYVGGDGPHIVAIYVGPLCIDLHPRGSGRGEV